MTTSVKQSSRRSPPTRVLQRPFVATLIGIALYWAAFPPLGASFLAWLAPVPWLTLIAAPRWHGKRPYWAIWAAATCGWLAILQGVRLPYWALYFGWLALSAYVALYVPAFIAMTRVLHHRWRIPLTVAAPLVWCGLEWVRGRYPVSFAVALLGHTQVRFPRVIQIADVAGAVTVSGLVMIVAVAIAVWFISPADAASPRSRKTRWQPTAVAVAALLAALGYGQWRLQTAPREKTSLGKVALLQGTFNTVFEYNPERNWETFYQYQRLAWEVSREHPDLQAIVWPESTLSGDNPETRIIEDPPPLEQMSPADYERGLSRLRQYESEFRERVEATAQLINSASSPRDATRQIAMIAGTSTQFIEGDESRRYNSALWIEPDGEIRDRYFKMHLVLFGEYVPLADRVQWIQKISVLDLLETGDGPKVFQVGEMALMPNICFESTVPQLIRRQIADVRGEGDRVDAMINMTHDGWFWGSSILDLHMACGVFRAVENRCPYLAAANPGLTYACDGNGRIEQILPREKPNGGWIVVDVVPDGRRSLYQWWGDLPFAFCAAAGLLLVLCPGRRSPPVEDDEPKGDESLRR